MDEFRAYFFVFCADLINFGADFDEICEDFMLLLSNNVYFFDRSGWD